MDWPSQRAAAREMHERAKADAANGDLGSRFPDGTRVVWMTTTRAMGTWLGTVIGRTRYKLRVRWDKSPEAPAQVYPIHVDKVTVHDDEVSTPASSTGCSTTSPDP